jgi:aryl-alcohol dehydrogenase-like predicted oxidoreductase
VRKLKVVADRLGISMAVLAIAWCIKNPNVTTAILGATHKEQLTENLKALDIYPKLNEEMMHEIENIVQTKPILPEY